MARKQMYVVKVVFTPKCPNCAIGVKQSGYLNGRGNMDTFEFKDNGFTIKAERSATYADGKILSSDRNGLYGQIMKGLLVYYALSSNFPKIKSISIVRKRKSPYTDVSYSETADFKQPLKPNMTIRALTFSQQNIDEILNETPKGYAIRTAMTYWLKAANSSDVYFRFDRYWKTYDCLLLYEGNTKNQKDAIMAIKNKITDKDAFFTKSKELINTYSDDYIRSFSWNNLLYKKSNKYKNANEIVRRATEYKDSRAVRLYKHLLDGPRINTLLVNGGKRNAIDSHFNANITTTKDIDIVLLMSLSYTYDVRCRMFHAEIPDSTFKLKETNEDYELAELVKLLEIVTFELLDNNNILR